MMKTTNGSRQGLATVLHVIKVCNLSAAFQWPALALTNVSGPVKNFQNFSHYYINTPEFSFRCLNGHADLIHFKSLQDFFNSLNYSIWTPVSDFIKYLSVNLFASGKQSIGMLNAGLTRSIYTVTRNNKLEKTT